MKRTQKEIRKQMEEFLDERYAINMAASTFDDTVINTAYYKGALRACELLGYNWTRNESGEHKLFKN
jgi:hypothetical protein